MRGVRQAWRVLWNGQRRWRRRSAWNGFLAEAEGVGHCGHGWTRKRALRSLERIQAGRQWVRHDCGNIRLGSSAVPRRYCVECEVSTRRGWAAMPHEWEPRAAVATADTTDGSGS